YRVSISAPKRSSWTIASPNPHTTSAPTTGMATRENRSNTGSAPVLFRDSASKGASAPTQKATATPWTNTAGPVTHSGAAVAAWLLKANDSPTPAIDAAVNRHAIAMLGLCHATRATSIDAIAINSE